MISMRRPALRAIALAILLAGCGPLDRVIYQFKFQTTCPAQDYGDITWSPDGRHLAFFYGQRPSYAAFLRATAIYMINADGTHPALLADVSGMTNRQPAWSPDGKRIAFTSQVAKGLSSIYIANIDGSEMHRVRQNVEDYEPVWSPDGKRIAFTTEVMFGWNTDISLTDADGTAVTDLTPTDTPEIFPSWSPDGTHIAFLNTPSEAINRLSDLDLFVMDADGSHVRQLTKGLSAWLRPTYLLDGSHILQTTVLGMLVSVAPATGQVTPLTRNMTVGSFRLLPDGQHILVMSDYTQPIVRVVIMRIDGSDVREIPSTLSKMAEIAISPDGTRVAFIRDARLYMANIDGSNQQDATPFAVGGMCVNW